MHHVSPLLFGSFLTLIHLWGVYYAVRAIMTGRAAHATIAWTLSLIMLPYIAVPLYLIFGRNKFYGYAEMMRQAYQRLAINVEQIFSYISHYEAPAVF